MSDPTARTLHLKVLTGRKLLAEAEVDGVSLPTIEGEVGILPGHRPLFVAVGRGVLSFRVAKSEERFLIQGGYAEVLPEKVLVFTELSEHGDEGTGQG
jgi:F-type H+-transporting ATPase subunit epsilon